MDGNGSQYWEGTKDVVDSFSAPFNISKKTVILRFVSAKKLYKINIFTLFLSNSFHNDCFSYSI